MTIDQLYDEARKPIPRRLRAKLERIDRFRILQYEGQIGSPMETTARRVMADLHTAAQYQIQRRMMWTAIVAASAGIASVIIVVAQATHLFA